MSGNKTIAPSNTCPKPEVCSPADCHQLCGLAVVDALLQETAGVDGDDVDALLDLRSGLRRLEDAEAALAIFCRLRRSMEERHYLLFYRLRRWLENHVQVKFVAVRGGMARTLALRLDGYCLEAIRCNCVRSAIRPGEPLLAPRISFSFRVLQASSAPRPDLEFA
jgi:hypothetical protein